MIIDKCDATKHSGTKMSPTFKRLVHSFNWVDSFRVLHQSDIQFSRYYTSVRGEGASRIDRCYHYGDIKVISVSYLPLAFSDHHAHVVPGVHPHSESKQKLYRIPSFKHVCLKLSAGRI
jgi:hypothetical protein